ncbi:ABC transporter substrate-binding protein [Microbacterium sp. YJN-G]|uniref:ABC transporter substrate-binding protein n=1 Tax=Microbacterium sp. YJN-G TaxID=2763257 RepID=UPI0018779023|nr:ABC transporter substrate-binding protein [Microbacterium sp. YJN-G]
MLILSSFITPAVLTAARGSGLLTGIHLEEVRATGSPAQRDGLRSGDLDLAVTAIDNLFEWTRAGVDVCLVGQVERTTPLSVHAAPEITTLADLAGARFAVDAPDSGFAVVARHMLRTAGTDVEWVEVGGVVERFEALVAGTVDATLLGPPLDDRALAAGLPRVASVQEAFPAFPGQGLIVRGDLIGTPELDDLLAALRAAGMSPVDPAGLDLLTAMREDLGVLPRGSDLHALVHPFPATATR